MELRFISARHGVIHRALTRELGWSPSQVVREGLRILEASYLRRNKRGIIGLGRFCSGVSDLGANQKLLRNFGK